MRTGTPPVFFGCGTVLCAKLGVIPSRTNPVQMRAARVATPLRWLLILWHIVVSPFDGWTVVS